MILYYSKNKLLFSCTINTPTIDKFWNISGGDSCELFGIRCSLFEDESTTEVRSFQLRNDKLVENGRVKWKCSETSSRRFHPEIKSACNV